ncbi:hypothetical protein HanPI659440_Chr12g0450431 [Helianthus annuus]|nr:hypothetical protein HanPI659440_Chr12g0450431 [Helianthus annuus]
MPSIITTTTTTINSRRRLWRLGKKKPPTVRLGGQRHSQGGGGSGSAMVRLIQRVRIRWLKLKKARVLKKLKEYYLCVLKDITERDRSLEKHNQLLLMETSFAVPVMGISINSFR